MQLILHRRWVLFMGWLLVAPVCLADQDSWVLVKRVLDGDTVELADTVRLRLSGINAPEINRARPPAQAGAHQAYAWLQTAIEGHPVRLEYDQERTDHYGRHLVYLFDQDGRHINEELVRLGLATINPHPPNLRYHAPLLHAQERARQHRRGIWNHPDHAPTAMDNIRLASFGRWGRFIGRVQSVERVAAGARLWFSDHAYVWIPKQYLGYFETLDGYVGQSLEVMAWPQKRGSRYSLRVRHPSQLR